MKQRLSSASVLASLASLSHELSPRQMGRLRELAEAIGPDGTIPMPVALGIATASASPEAAQAAFRKFRATVNEAASAAGASLSLQVDTRKTQPESRACWFEGEDLVREGVSEMSAREAERARVEAPIEQDVAEVMPRPETVRVYVSFDAPLDERRDVHHAEQFVDMLTARAAVRTGPEIHVSDALQIPLGRDPQQVRTERLRAADIVLVLLGPGYFAGQFGERDRLASEHVTTSALVAFDSMPPGALRLDDLPSSVISQQSRPWKTLSSHKAKSNYVDDVLALIDRLAETLPSTTAGAAVLEPLIRRALRRGDVGSEVVRAYAYETDMRAPNNLQRGPSDPEPVPVSASERIIDWATDRSGATPRLCALLGDTGMGKTTTTKVVTSKLLDMRESGEKAPLPILLDLRNVRAAGLGQTPTVRGIVAQMLSATEGLGRAPEVDDVLGVIAAGGCLVIFDGLDEVLVHLSPSDGQNFTRALLRVIEAVGDERADAGVGPTKVLISCRTHYFRSVRDQVAHFMGERRENVTASDYLALIMLPFRETQIREFLQRNLPHVDVARALVLLSEVHNLREMSGRPLTLGLIADQLTPILEARAANIDIKSVDLYDFIIQEWLARDNGKHNILPSHKILLMEYMAAELWRSGRRDWTAEEMEQWLLEFVATRPDIRLHYERIQPDLWKEDLRTATFVVRSKDRYSFAHASVFEYFFAMYLFRELHGSAVNGDSMPDWFFGNVTVEVLEFLAEKLESSMTPEKLIGVLGRLSRAATKGPSEVAIGSLLTLMGRGAVSLDSGLDCSGAQLGRWEIGGLDRMRDVLIGATFKGARLDGAVFMGLDLRGCDFRGASMRRVRFEGCRLDEADLAGVRLDGSQFIGCDFGNAHFDSGPVLASAVACVPEFVPGAAGWEHAPALPGMGGVIVPNKLIRTQADPARNWLTIGGSRASQRDAGGRVRLGQRRRQRGSR